MRMSGNDRSHVISHANEDVSNDIFKYRDRKTRSIASDEEKKLRFAEVTEFANLGRLKIR
jgi:hypothetical protein